MKNLDKVVNKLDWLHFYYCNKKEKAESEGKTEEAQIIERKIEDIEKALTPLKDKIDYLENYN